MTNSKFDILALELQTARRAVLQRSTPHHLTFVENESEFRFAVAKNPNLILVNTDAPPAHWRSWLALNLHRQAPLHIGVLGYATADPVARLNAIDFGCDNVVSTRAIENNINLQIDRHARPFNIDDKPLHLPQEVLEGISLFNARKFHEAHDAIEPLWLKEKRGVRLLYAGILQIGIAFYFIERGGYAQALRMFGHGRAKLVPFFPHCMGIPTEEIFNASTRAFRELKALGEEKIALFPKQFFFSIPIPKR